VKRLLIASVALVLITAACGGGNGGHNAKAAGRTVTCATYCVLAPQAVEGLRARGFKARRLGGGMPEWRLAELPVATAME
jgi:hypothetical protein